MVKRRMIRSVCSQIMVFLFFVMFSMNAYAKQEIHLMQHHSQEDRVSLYLTGADNVSAVSGQIGRKEAEVDLVSDAPSVHTVILIDNSLSITQANQKKIHEVITQYAQQKSEKEVISIAVYGEDITYLIEKETDAQKIIDSLSQIEYLNQDSYLTDILYEEIEGLTEEREYTRFIVATDGVDNKAIGYTKEELTSLLEESNYPLYALGCVYKDNTSELENLFALSRSTNAKQYLLDDYEEFTEIINGFAENISQVVIQVPEDYRDGSRQNVLLSFTTEDGKTDISCELKMPFQIEQNVEPESTTEELSVVETVEETVVVETTVAVEESSVEMDETEGQVDFVAIGAIVIIVAALLALLVMKKGKKEKSKPSKKEVANNLENDRTEILQTPLTYSENSDFTVLLNNKEADYKLILQDANEKMRIFSYPMINNSVIVGRSSEAGAQIALNYNNSVSKKHCKITSINGRFYVEDLAAVNGTWLNGVRISNRTEFENGAVLRLGNLELIVFVERMD